MPNNQYLPPDLPPLPSAMDPKRSPLAMLVQTCSSIGKDMPSKPIIPTLDKIASDEDSKKRAQGAKSPRNLKGRNQVSPRSEMTLHKPKQEEISRQEPSYRMVKQDKGKRSPSQHPMPRAEEPKPKYSHSQPPLTTSSSGNNYPGGLSPAAYYHHLLPHLNPAYQAELLAQIRLQKDKLAAHLLTSASPASPPCRDPFCATCQLSQLQSLTGHGQSCLSGCGQCTDKVPRAHQSPTAPNLSCLPPALLSLYGLPGLNQTPIGSSAASLPYACHWVTGAEYCGKRFPSSDDLLQHMKCHVTEASATSVSPVLSPYSLGAAAALSPAGLHGSGAHRFMSSQNRFHPYGGGKSGAARLSPPAAQVQSHGIPAALLGPYASLYGHRFGLGAAAATP